MVAAVWHVLNSKVVHKANKNLEICSIRTYVQKFVRTFNFFFVMTWDLSFHDNSPRWNNEDIKLQTNVN